MNGKVFNYLIVQYFKIYHYFLKNFFYKFIINKNRIENGLKNNINVLSLLPRRLTK